MSEASSPSPHRRQSLAALDGRMTDEELRQWLDGLADDPEAVERYVECVELCEELATQPEQRTAERPGRPRGFLAWAVAATLLIAGLPAA